MKRLKNEDKKFIQEKLVSWFKKSQRDLPWRKTYDPYQVWISEIMLQQTQVATALPYFKRWLTELPTVKSVAEAKEDKVLKLWEGLGYYSRARNLQKAARAVMEEHQGSIPKSHEEILKLPGIGKYTAGAITSIAFNQEKPIVDGNVIRVLARLFNFSENTKLPNNLKKFWLRAEDLIPKGQARYFNQGMMELGALICKPQNPNCQACPLQKKCESYKKGNQNELPFKGEKQEKIPIKVSIAVIRKNGKIFIQKRPSKGLMGGLWEFPGGKAEKGETAPETLKREISEELGITLKNVKKIKKIKHGYTKYSVDLTCFEAEPDQGNLQAKSASESKWVKPEELGNYPFPVANLKLIKDLL